MLDSVALAIKAVLAFIPVSLMVVISTGIASMMGEFMGPAHYMHDAVVAFCTPVWLMVFAFAVLMFVWESIQCKIEERAMRKAGLLSVLIACIMIPVGLQAGEVKYSSLEESAKINLEKAIVKGDQKAIDSASKTLDIVVRSRYLSATAEINESMKPLIEGFAPQIASAPMLLKGMGKVGILGNQDLFGPFAQAIAGWLTANSPEAAKAALGDIEGLMQAQVKFDEAATAVLTKAPYDTPWEEKKAASRKAGNQEADALWASGK